MGIIYIAALIIGGGVLAVQLLMGHEADADAHVDAGHLGAGHLGAGHVSGGHVSDVHDAAHDAGGFAAIVLSLRFWTFGLLAFGLSGALLEYVVRAGALLTPLLAAGMGLASGYFAAWLISVLIRTGSSSGAGDTDAVGQVGKVLVSLSKEQPGKVRVELKGQSIDYLAITDEEAALEAGADVLVEEANDGTLRVSRAREPFLPPED